MHQKTYPRRLNAKEVLITQRDVEFVFPVAYGSAKIIRKTLRFPRTHSETGIHRKERISTENLMATGQSSNRKKPKMTLESMDFWAHAEAREEFHLSSSY